jgi:1-acyl-sn-glycerol-3-phosphate acyltransferase
MLNLRTCLRLFLLLFVCFSIVFFCFINDAFNALQRFLCLCEKHQKNLLQKREIYKNKYLSFSTRWLCQLLQIEFRLSEESRKSISQLEKKPHLILSNHLSYLDIVALSCVSPGLFLAKKEVGSWPIFGRVARSLGVLFVERESLTGRVRALFDISKKLKVNSLVVFPEGTTTAHATPSREHWKPGQIWCAHHAGVPLMAVGLQLEDFSELSWVDDMTLGPHLWKVLKRDRTRIAISCQILSLNELKKHGSIRNQAQTVYDAVVSMCLNSANLLKAPQEQIKLNSSLPKLTTH